MTKQEAETVAGRALGHTNDAVSVRMTGMGPAEGIAWYVVIETASGNVPICTAEEWTAFANSTEGIGR